MEEIILSSTYICPIRGLAGLEPPEPGRLDEAAKISAEHGLERLFFPLLEEALVSSVRTKINYLDGTVRVLDCLEEIGLEARLIAPARRVLGLDWVPPYLIKGSPDPKGPRVYIDGKVRQVRPYNWWKDPSVVEQRVRVFREILSALSGHPALKGWVIMDRALEWPRPESIEAGWVYRSYLSEIRDRDEEIAVYAGLGWPDLLQPQTALELVSGLDGLRLSGLDLRPEPLRSGPGLTGELQLAAYVGGLSGWLFEQPVEVEAGWSRWGEDDEEELIAAGCQLRESGVQGLCWANLIDPEPGLYPYPPWNLKEGLNRMGLFHPFPEPKAGVEALFKEMKKIPPLENPYDFIDIDRQEYLEDPRTHFIRLWHHFIEFIS